jgi:hypothetical protein
MDCVGVLPQYTAGMSLDVSALTRKFGIDDMAIPDAKTFTGKDWAMLIGVLVLVVVLVYVLWARRR